MSLQALAFPTSFAQERLWFLEHLEPGSSVYHISAVIRLTGPLYPEVMERCFNEIVARHEVLRTRFASLKGNSVQVILPHCMLTLPIIDLTSLPAEERETVLEQLFKEQAHTPFPLDQAPLLRLKLLRFASQEHVLLLTMHHLVSDGWSIGVLIQEFSLLYRAYLDGLPSPLPDIPLQYADFAQWQREWLQGKFLEEQLAFWKKELAGSPPVLQLPIDHPRPAVPTRRGARRHFRVPYHLYRHLDQLGRGEGCTLFMTLLAAFKILLHRYTGEEDLVVGSPVANRNRMEIETLIGFFVNTVVLRTDLSGDPSFIELLERVRKVTLSVFEHQDLPFEVLVETLKPARDLSRTPLFQVMFVLQNAPSAELALPGVELEFLELDPETAKFDLTLIWEKEGDALRGVVEYSCDIFEPATIDRLIIHLLTLLQSATARPEARLSELLYLPPEERVSLLPVCTLPETFGIEKMVHVQFEVQAERVPEAIALVLGEERLTYAELNQRANRLAHLLKSHGVGPEVLVGICLERSVEMVVGILAILKAGGAYLPLDPGYPGERLVYLIKDSGTPLLITQRPLLAEFETEGVTQLFLDELDEVLSGLSQENIPCECAPEHLAYVIYTSGSTGNPKGVQVEHGNLSRLFSATDPWYHFKADDVWTLFHSFAFDFSVWELWGALIHGGRLVLVPYLVSRSPADFYDLLVREGVTVLNQTPSAFRQLMQEEESREEFGELALRYVIFGGEALEVASLRPWFERHGDSEPQLVNMYGITETTVHVTYRPLTAEDVVRGSVIGVPISDLELYLLDQYRQPVPVGVAGELYVGGAGVARGYLKRPELTSERFLENPFTGKGRLYRTGDLARRLDDGELEYLGRADHQVKIRGFRIEPGEIEAAVLCYPGVREAVVLPWEYQDGKRLVAYLVAQGMSNQFLGGLRLFLKEQLPEYMVPAQLVLLESFPLTQNGKIDRKALPSSGEPQGRSSTFFPPRTPVEELLADIWGEVLELDRVGIRDNFFDIGGDSIRSIQVLARIRKAGLEFSLSQLFQYQNIEELARVVEPARLEADCRVTEPFVLVTDEERQKLTEDVVDAYPLSALQQGMLFYSELNPESAVYHDIFSYHLRAPWNHEALLRALTSLAERHAVLRTGFVFVGFDQPLQLVYRLIELPLTVTDLQDIDPARQEEIVAKWVAEEKIRGFTFSEAPLLRFQVHLRSSESFSFTMSFHHAILDGWSVASLLTELFREYFVRAAGEEPLASPLPEVRFSDFIALERVALDDPASLQFWQERVAGVTSHSLPRWPALLQQVAPHGVHEVPLDGELYQKLEQLARHSGTPLKAVLLAAHLHVLTALYDSDQVTTGIVTNGRPEGLGAEQIAGLFLNTLPFTLELSGGSWTELVRWVFAEEQSLLPHRRYPLSEVQRLSGGVTLFDSAFNFTNFHVYRGILRVEGVEVLGGDFFERTNFTLVANFSLDPVSMRLNLKLAYDPAQLHPEQVEAWGRYYLETLTAMAEDPNGLYQEHTVLPEADRLLQLKEWNDTAANYPSDRLLHQFFEEQALSYPERIALRFEGDSLSYGELNQRANRLARYLRRLGTGPEVVVVVSLERSPLMVVSLLAVLKAGGAYLPFDPGYPKERLCYLVEDSGARIVIGLCELPGVAPRVRQLNPELEQEEIDRESSENPDVQTGPDQAAYVIYTSGSTGTPKGVVNLHRAISNRLIWMQDTYQLTYEDAVLQKTPFSFDVSVWEFFWPLMYGACLVLARPEGHKNREYLIDLIIAEGITTLHFVPSMLQIFLEDPRVGSCRSVKRVICSGEVLPAELQERFFARLNAELHNLYGPTEAAVDVTYWRCLKDPSATCVPIGRPIANVSTFILDRRLHPAPIGVPGELHLGGVALARGYLNRPELTAEKFLPNPFGKDGERMYRTGDLARFRPDGVIEYLGRLDSQVKLRGFRIELGEIESSLSAHPDVAQAVVLLRSDEGDPRLVAYLTAAAGEAPSMDDLRASLRRSLPDYMIPSAFVVLDSFPLNRNGKLDRKALPAPGGERRESRPYLPPRDELEQELVRIWCQVLKLDRIGIEDDFFQAGGHSLLVTQVVSRMRAELKLELPLRSLFDAPTIASYATLVHTTRAEQSAFVKAAPLIPVSRDRYRGQLSAEGEIDISLELRAEVQALHPKIERRVQ